VGSLTNGKHRESSRSRPISRVQVRELEDRSRVGARRLCSRADIAKGGECDDVLGQARCESARYVGIGMGASLSCSASMSSCVVLRRIWSSGGELEVRQLQMQCQRIF
jgi:hypothetical protein